MTDPKRPTVEQLREAWLRWPQHNPQSEHGLGHAFGVAWRDCVPCAIYAAIDLIAEAKRASAPLGDSDHGLVAQDAYQVLGPADATASAPAEPAVGDTQRCSGHVWMALDGYPGKCSVCGASRAPQPATPPAPDHAELLDRIEAAWPSVLDHDNDNGHSTVESCIYCALKACLTALAAPTASPVDVEALLTHLDKWWVANDRYLTINIAKSAIIDYFARLAASGELEGGK